MYFNTAVVLALCSVALARPVRFQRRAATALDTGSCGSPEIQFANGLDGRNEPSFQALNQQDFNHGSALNIGVIADFVCGQLQSKCKASADTVAACDQGTQAAAQATDGAAADAFNAALGITSNFAAGAADGTAAAPAGGDAAATGSDATGASSAANATDTGAANATSTDSATSNSTANANGAAALDTGSCGSPEIQFANGLDGRNEPSFQAVNQADFNHGSALNIGVIASFVCGQLKDKCKASADTVATCDTATQDAAQATGGAAADAFNAALGITSNFAAGATDGTAAGATGASNATTVNTGAGNATASAGSVAPSSTSSATAAGDDLQTFTGALGATPPAVTASGNGQFQVDGNASFNNLQNALVRDVQHNQCADAANASGNSGDLTVAACGTQQTQCNAAAQSSAAA